MYWQCLQSRCNKGFRYSWSGLVYPELFFLSLLERSRHMFMMYVCVQVGMCSSVHEVRRQLLMSDVRFLVSCCVCQASWPMSIQGVSCWHLPSCLRSAGTIDVSHPSHQLSVGSDMNSGLHACLVSIVPQLLPWEVSVEPQIVLIIFWLMT